MIEVRELKKSFGETVAVDGITFSVSKGEVIGFLGPNGAGKTTTIRIITGFLRADYGKAKVAGFDVEENPVEIKKRIGYLPEENPLYNDLTVKEYLDFISEIRGIRSEQKKEAIEKAVETCAIGEVYRRPIGELSRGYRQRVGLAQALLHDPEILILDEPTSGLDPTQIVEIRSLIKELGKEKTIIISTHILPEVSVTSTRVIIINKGRIVASGTPDELSKESVAGFSLHMEVKAPLEEVEKALDEVPWVLTWNRTSEKEGGIYGFVLKGREGEDIRENLFRLAVEKGWILLELWREKATLEEVFLQLAREE